MAKYYVSIKFKFGDKSKNNGLFRIEKKKKS